MESFVITWRELLIAVILVLAVYVAEMLLLVRSRKSGGASVWRRRDAVVQPQGLQALETEVAQLREQVVKLQAEMERMKAVPHPAATPYSQAIQLAQQGLDVNEVAASCGISRGEAELIVALHRTNPSP